MKLIYITLAISAVASLVFMLLWAQSESEKAQLLDKTEVIRSIARQEQEKSRADLSATMHKPTELIENAPVITEQATIPQVVPVLIQIKSKEAEISPQLPIAASAPSPAPVVAMVPENLQKIKNIQQRLLAQMSSGNAINIDEVAKLIGELQGMEKLGVNFHGMDFTIAKKNLELVKQIQDVSENIQVINKDTPPDMSKLNSSIERLKKLQMQIKSPMGVTP